MIETAISAFGGGSIATAIITIIIKMWDRGAEAKERTHILAKERTELEIKALEATAHRTNNFWGNIIRFLLAIVPQCIMLALLYIGYNNPDAVIWYGQKQEPQQISLFFGFFEYTSKPETTWREFSGIVILPALFAQMGAVNTYYLVSGMFSRR